MDGDVGRVLAAARSAACESGLPAFDPRRNAGFWRFLVLRRSLAGETWAVAVTSDHPDGDAAVRTLADALGGACEGLAGVVHGIRRERTQVAQWEEERAIWGRQRLREECGGIEYEFAASSFFQTNTVAAGELFATVREFASLSGSERSSIAAAAWGQSPWPWPRWPARSSASSFRPRPLGMRAVTPSASALPTAVSWPGTWPRP